MRKYWAIIIILLGSAWPALAGDGAISVTAAKTDVTIGDTFAVNIRATSAGVKANTVGVDLNYPADLLKAVSVSGPSVITLYVDKGIKSGGAVTVQGGILPAKVLAGSAIGTVTFKALKTGTATISVAKTSGIYADDGAGTDLLAAYGGVAIKIMASKPVLPPPAVNVNVPPTPVMPTPPVVTPPPEIQPTPVAPITEIEENAAPQVVPVSPASDFEEITGRTLLIIGVSAAMIVLGIWFLVIGLVKYGKRKRK